MASSKASRSSDGWGVMRGNESHSLGFSFFFLKSSLKFLHLILEYDICQSYIASTEISTLTLC